MCLCGGLNERCLQQSPSFNHWALVGTVEGSLVDSLAGENMPLVAVFEKKSLGSFSSLFSLLHSCARM